MTHISCEPVALHAQQRITLLVSVGQLFHFHCLLVFLWIHGTNCIAIATTVYSNTTSLPTCCLTICFWPICFLLFCSLQENQVPILWLFQRKTTQELILPQVSLLLHNSEERQNSIRPWKSVILLETLKQYNMHRAAWTWLLSAQAWLCLLCRCPGYVGHSPYTHPLRHKVVLFQYNRLSSLVSSFPQYFLMTILIFNPCFSQHHVSSTLYFIICMVSHIHYTISSICSLNISKPLTPPYSAAQASNHMKCSNTFKRASSFSLWEMANKL